MTIFTPKVQHALELASRLHRDQLRRDALQTPYITHLVGVMLLVSEVTTDEDTLCAALLHDSLEDVQGFTKEMLVAELGERVAELVSYVTEPYIAGEVTSEQSPWLLRKEAYVANLDKGDASSAIVSCADKLHNLTSLVAGYKKEGDEFLKNFHGSMKNQLGFYEKVVTVLESKLEANNLLLLRLKSKYEEGLEVFGTQ